MPAQLHLFFNALIFLSAFIKVSVASEFAANFTTVPRDAEFFVGSEAVFQWKYISRPPDAVRKIIFGIVALPQDRISANEDIAILVKDTLRGDVQRNTKQRTDVIGSLNRRTSVLKNQTASFKITNLTLNDTGRYFCRLEPEISISTNVETRYVNLKVVDLMIDHEKSTTEIDSWDDHKITLKCAVKASPGSIVRFFWQQPNRTSAIGKQRDWSTLSEVTMVTALDSDFNPVTCIAETNATTQRLEVKIKRLYKPSEPVNFTLEEVHSNDTDCKIYNKLTWSPPVDEGETPITGYLVEYKHPVISGILTNKITTFNTEHVMCKLQVSGHPRELKVDVRGINKVGRGFRSNTVKVSFYSTPSAPLNVTSSLVRKEQPPFDAWLFWNPPDESGGMPVVKYSLEYKVLGAPWEDAEVMETNNTYQSIAKYGDSYIYEVRIRAGNMFGFGSASKIKIIYFAEKPDPPRNLARGEVFSDNQNAPNLKVTWDTPKYDGGAAISRYIVEYKTVKEEWSTADNASVNVTKFAFEVEKSEIYTVRVRAVNPLGAGEPSVVINVKLTEEDVKTLARSNKSSSLTGCGIFEALLLLFAVFDALV